MEDARFSRRALSLGMAAMSGGLAASAAAGAAPADAVMVRGAPGLRMAYVDSPLGQLHYRHAGAGPALVMLHWAPASGRQYEPVMPYFAGAGLTPLAFDLPGYGRSCKARRGFSVEEMAEALLSAVTALGHREFHLLGGHLSASVAACMAVMAPWRVRTLTLDGVLLLEPEEWTALLARFAGKSPMPSASSDYRSFPFDMTVETLREWNPDFILDETTLEAVYDLLNDYMEMGLAPMRAFVEPDDKAPPPFDLASALKALRVPTLTLSAAREPLRASFQRVTKLISGAEGHSFPGTHPLVTAGQAEGYARRILAHIRKG